MTELFLKIVEEHLASQEEHFKEALINSVSIGTEDLHRYSQLKGQILTLREIKDIKTFMIDEIERLDDERDSFRTQSVIEDGGSQGS